MAGIDRDFWLEYAKNGVLGNITSTEAAAKNLDTFLMVLWTIFTTAFAVASFLDALSGTWWQIVLVGLPILVIMVARYYCTLVSLPSFKDGVEADPNIVEEIIDSYIIISHDKKNRLKIANQLTLVAILSVFIALVGYNQLDPNRAIKDKIKLNKLLKDEKDTYKLTDTSALLRSNLHTKDINDNLDKQSDSIIKSKKLEFLKGSDKKYFDSLIKTTIKEKS